MRDISLSQMDESCRDFLGIPHSDYALDKLLSLILPAKFRDILVTVSHSDCLQVVGGIEKFLHDEQFQFQQHGFSSVHVYPYDHHDQDPASKWGDLLVGVNVDLTPAGVFTLRELALSLHALRLAGLVRIAAIHIHHLLHSSLPGLKYVMDVLASPFVRFFIHDYHSLCPQFYLLRNDQSYCGCPPPDSPECRECAYGESRPGHCRRVRAFFASTAMDFIVPSEVAAHIWKGCYPEFAPSVSVVPHQTAKIGDVMATDRIQRLAASDQPPRIAFIGNNFPHKGADVWQRMATRSSLVGRIEFFHLGLLHADLPGVQQIPVSYIDDGPGAMVKALNEHHIDMAFLWSTCPETYSFTVFEAFSSGCFVLTNAMSGNIAAQVQTTGRGMVFADEDRLIQFLEDVSTLRTRLVSHYRSHPVYVMRMNDHLAVTTAASHRGSNEPEPPTASEPSRQMLCAPDLLPLREQLIVEQTRSRNLLAMVRHRTELTDQLFASHYENRKAQAEKEHLQATMGTLRETLQTLSDQHTAYVQEIERRITISELIIPQHPLAVGFNDMLMHANAFLSKHPSLLRMAGPVAAVFTTSITILLKPFRKK